jgi:hypothetical protein
VAINGGLMSGWLVGCRFDSSGQGADLDEVAGEDAVPARGSGHAPYAELVQFAVD